MPALRCDVRGLLERAAVALDKADDGGRAFALRELSEHLVQVAQDPPIWPEFAELYCLKREDLDRELGRAA